MKTHRHFLAPAALIVLTIAPTLASAQAFKINEVVVAHDDLNLSTRSGVARLDHRIRNAINTACGEASAADPAGKNKVRSCRAEAMELARAHRDERIANYRGSQTNVASRQ